MILIVIAGATATGKSQLALLLGLKFNTVIINADSRQVYRELDIGTAKPSRRDQELVPHYLIDICDPTENLTVADYQAQVYNTIDQEHFESALLVGGTGLYIKSVVRGMKIPRVSPIAELREQLSKLGQGYCYQLLQQVDAIAAQKIHFNDQLRTIRALEVYYVTGKPISELQGEAPPNYKIYQIGLDGDWDRLHKQIAIRTKSMLAQGLVGEVESLVIKYGYDLPLLNTLGYQEIILYLKGEISLDQAMELIMLHTRQLAKRQKTWFRAISDIEWYDMDDPLLLSKITQRIAPMIGL